MPGPGRAGQFVCVLVVLRRCHRSSDIRLLRLGHELARLLRRRGALRKQFANERDQGQNRSSVERSLVVFVRIEQLSADPWPDDSRDAAGGEQEAVVDAGVFRPTEIGSRRGFTDSCLLASERDLSQARMLHASLKRARGQASGLDDREKSAGSRAMYRSRVRCMDGDSLARTSHLTGCTSRL